MSRPVLLERRRFWFPPGRDGVKLAPQVALVRALLLEQRPPVTASSDYLRLLEKAQVGTQLVRQKVKTDLWAAIALLAQRDSWRDKGLPPGWGEGEAFREYALAVNDFCQKWLYGGGQDGVNWLVAQEKIGIDPMGIRQEKTLLGTVFAEVYGGLTSRDLRRRHQRAMAYIRRMGGQLIDIEVTLAHARAWVELHHVYGGRLTRWLQETGKTEASSDYFTPVSTWSKIFALFDDAIGRPRSRGRPQTV